MGECQYDFCNKVLVNADKNQKKLVDVLKHVSHLLKVHEDSQEHNTHMATWKELEVVLQSG